MAEISRLASNIMLDLRPSKSWIALAMGIRTAPGTMWSQLMMEFGSLSEWNYSYRQTLLTNQICNSPLFITWSSIDLALFQGMIIEPRYIRNDAYQVLPKFFSKIYIFYISKSWWIFRRLFNSSPTTSTSRTPLQTRRKMFCSTFVIFMIKLAPINKQSVSPCSKSLTTSCVSKPSARISGP